jgi:hypothetical protein
MRCICCPALNRLGVYDKPPKIQPFPMRHSFIPTYIQFDLSVVSAHILWQSKAELKIGYAQPHNF